VSMSISCFRVCACFQAISASDFVCLSNMLWLICHVLVGGAYRAELGVRYRLDVCEFGSVADIGLHARDFDSGLFDCFHGDRVLRRNCYACWCAPVLFGVDASSSGFMSFWLALVLTSIFLPLIWIFGFIERMYIRRRFRMESHHIMDFCAWFFCVPCALVQEHKFMEKTFSAKRRGLRDAEILPEVPVAASVEAPLETSATS
jgi:Cys-rich protein (TIGR01571 family)